MKNKRLSALDSAIIKQFFTEFERLQHEYKVESQNIYNMNETGFQMSQVISKYVVFDPAMDHPVTLTADNNQWVSVIECVDINEAIKLYLIFVDKAPKDHMFSHNDELSDIIWAFSPKEWTDRELAVDWLQHIFISKMSRQNKHSFLILNNHDSYITDEFQYYCLQNNIHPLYLPAHVTHKLQSLNIDSFLSLFKAYSHAVKEYISMGITALNQSIFV